MKKTIILTILGLGSLSGLCDAQDTLSAKKGDTSIFLARSYLATTGTMYTAIPKDDTVSTITYCLNLKTLNPKWIKIKAIPGWNNSSVYFHGLIIYKKYLNVPKGYKAIYSIKL